MKDYYKQIPGWFDFEDVYDEIVAITPNNSLVVELGCYLGKSICYLASKIKDSKKNITIYGVDNFYLNSDATMYFRFLENMVRAELLDKIISLKLDVIEASKLFGNKSCFFVFIDADHSYNTTINNIKMWLPKIQQGGILAGHDYHENWSGVMKAVDEIFGKDKEIKGNSWIVRI